MFKCFLAVICFLILLLDLEVKKLPKPRCHNICKVQIGNFLANIFCLLFYFEYLIAYLTDIEKDDYAHILQSFGFHNLLFSSIISLTGLI